jgi:shikimate kinase
MSQARVIIITGFMASGKTTVARALARDLRCESIDLDQFVSDQTRRTPKEIIERDGESAFREVETACLREALKKDGPLVIALGGGAWTIEPNRELIAARGGFTVWLDTPFELCWQRISASGSDRPLAPDREQAHNLYLQRRSLYQLASLPLIADGETDAAGLAATIVRTITGELR